MSRRIGIAAASVALMLLSILPAGTVTAAGYSTPEDAVRAYLTAFAEADFDGMLDTVAIDETSEGYRFDLAVDRLNAWVLSLKSPSEYDFYTDVNRAERRSEIATAARLTAYTLLSDLDSVLATKAPADQEWANDFIEQVDPDRLDALAVVDVRTPTPDFLEETRTQANLAVQARTEGVDELSERVALVSLGGDLFVIGFRVVRVGDEWKVLSQRSHLAGIDFPTERTTADEFDELTRPS